MLQLHTTEQRALYKGILELIRKDVTTPHPTTTTITGRDLQSTLWQGDSVSYYASLQLFFAETGLIHITPTNIHTYIPGNTHIDHWLLRQPTTIPHYNTRNTHTSTQTPECGDRKAFILELYQIGDIQTPNAKRTDTSPTTRSHPPFILPIPQNLIETYTN
jgi:hypothetical protein